MGKCVVQIICKISQVMIARCAIGRSGERPFRSNGTNGTDGGRFFVKGRRD
jgi:hypothetical protein